MNSANLTVNDIPREAFANCLRHLQMTNLNDGSLLTRLSRTAESFLNGGDLRQTAGVLTDGAKVIANFCARAVRDLAEKLSDDQYSAVDQAEASLMQASLEKMYIENPVAAHEDGVVVVGQNGNLRVARPGLEGSPWAMAAWDIKNMPLAVKKEIIEFFRDNPDIAAQEGVLLQNLDNGDYLLSQDVRVGVTPSTVKLQANAHGSFDVRPLVQDQRQKQEARRLDPLFRQHTIQ